MSRGVAVSHQFVSSSSSSSPSSVSLSVSQPVKSLLSPVREALGWWRRRGEDFLSSVADGKSRRPYCPKLAARLLLRPVMEERHPEKRGHEEGARQEDGRRSAAVLRVFLRRD